MADARLDPASKNVKDRPPMRLADRVAPLNRIYFDSVTVPTEQMQQYVKEETERREVFTCTAPVAGNTHVLTLTDGFQVKLDGTGTPAASSASVLVVNVNGLATAAAVAARIASSVSAWLGCFVAISAGAKLGIYTSKGASAVKENTLGWVASSESVTIMRPGLPSECIPGIFHPKCPYLRLIGATFAGASDNLATFSREWQVDLAKLSENQAVDVEAMLKLGMTTSKMLEKSHAPPRQFLPWVKTISETQKARVDADPDNVDGVSSSTVNEENLASSSKTVTRVEWGTPFALTSRDFDPSTGVNREVIQRPVPAGTAAKGIGPDGRYTTVQEVDDKWAIESTVQAAGLAGQAVNGVKTDSWRYRDNWSWPRVLSYIDIQEVVADPQDIFSPAVGYSWRPIWLADYFSGLCWFTQIERWTKKKPVKGGDPNWSTLYDLQADEKDAEADAIEATNPGLAATLRAQATALRNASPDLPEETPMYPKEIVFQGRELRITLPQCLHSGVRIRDTQFFGNYPATLPSRWLETIIARVTLQQDQGGWRTTSYLVDAPSIDGLGSGIDLRIVAETATGFTLEWTAGAGETKLDIATNGSFTGGWLQGHRNLTVPGAGDPPQFVVTGAARGVIYYARIRRGALVSNTCACSTKPLPEVELRRNGQLALNNSTLSVGLAEIGAVVSVNLTMRSIGLLPLHDLALSISGPQADEYSVSTVPMTLNPGTEATVTVTLSPTSIGTRTAALQIASNAEDSPFVLNLTGIGAAAEIKLEQPAGTDVPSGATVAFGTVTGGAVSKVFKLLNVGNAPLRNLSTTVDGLDAPDFTLTVPLEVTELPAAGFANVTVTFDPTDDIDAAAARTAVLRITSSDTDEAEFSVTLTGTFARPDAPGSLDLSFDPNANGIVHAVAVQADGKALIGGDFTMIGATARDRIARLNADGSLDMSFNPGANGSVYAVALQSDGDILLAGAFTSVAGTTRNRVARVDNTGELDTGFNPGANGEVYTLAIQSDGKVLLGGAFTALIVGSRSYIARVSSAGALDAGFTTEVNGAVRGMAIGPDGYITIVGDFIDDTTTTTTTEETTTTTTEDTTTTTTEETTTTTTEDTTTTTTTTTEETTTTTTTEDTTTTTTTTEDTTTTEETTTTTEETTTTTTEETTTTTEPPEETTTTTTLEP